MFNKDKQFLHQELVRYQESLQNLTPGTEEYEQVYKTYSNIYSKLYSDKGVGEKVMDVLKLFVPVGASIFMGIFAYHKNLELESKDGDVWREAHEVRRHR